MQKSIMLGISVGEYFAEYSIVLNSQKTFNKRVYLSREGLKQSLSLFLNQNLENKPTHAFIALRVPKKVLDFEYNESVAYVTTKGFENWLDIHGNQERKHATQNLLFPIHERISAQGKIEETLTQEELESIEQKVAESGTKTVCLHFLHASINPTHLIQAQEFFIKKGYEVFAPIQSDMPDEVKRWNKNSLNATISSLINERKSEILSALDGIIDAENIHILSSSGTILKSSDQLGIDNIFAASTAMGTVLGGEEKADILYLGLEYFSLISPSKWNFSWQSPWGDVAVSHLMTRNLLIQPTSSIALNNFDRFDFGSTQEGWEPGPMFVGRGLKPCLLDLWADNSKINAVHGLEDRVAPQGIQKFKNTFFALSKISDSQGMEPSKLVKELQSLCIQRLALEAIMNRQKKKMMVTGPLAPVFANIFKKDPHAIISSDDFNESTSVALFGAQKLGER